MRIVKSANDHLTTGRYHLLNQPAFDQLVGNAGLLRHSGDRARHASCVHHIERDAADVGLVQDVARDNFDGERRSKSGQCRYRIGGAFEHQRFRHTNAERAQ